MSNNDPLQKLFVTESQAVNKKDLADLLSQYVSINRETQAMDFSGQFGKLPNAEKILIVLLAVKARSIFLETDDKITPSEIIKMEIAPTGSVKATLKVLLKNKEIKSEKGRYSLPNYKFLQVATRFKKLEKKYEK